ncbi:MAG TPA: class I SAM-dependent methyltransferase [archaeon]|nr:class I SAM-dependent methyltransferase [archaeon]
MPSYLETHYDGPCNVSPKYAEQFAKFVVKKFKPDAKSILDLGASYGDFLLAFKNLGLECFGAEIDNAGIKSCEAKEIKVVKVDLSKDKINIDKKFDIITCLETIEHFTDPTNILDNVKRLLAPDGIFIITTLNWSLTYKNFYHDYTHVKPYNPRALKRMLMHYGFKIEKILPRLGLPLIWRWSQLAFAFHMKPEIFCVAKLNE